MFERKLTRKEVELIKEIEAFVKDKHMSGKRFQGSSLAIPRRL